jgi:hypothetical protein
MGPGASAAAARTTFGAARRKAAPAHRPIDRRIVTAAALTLFAAITSTGLAASWLARPPVPEGVRTVTNLTPRPLALPGGWFVRSGPAQAAPDRIDLVVPWAALAGGGEAGTMRVTATRASETDMPLSAARRYARFLTPEAEPRPDGLMRRHFRAGSPFDGEDLYLEADGSRFWARCATGSVPEPDAACLSEVRIGSVGLRVRFAAERLPAWREGLAGLERIFGTP